MYMRMFFFFFFFFVFFLFCFFRSWHFGPLKDFACNLVHNVSTLGEYMIMIPVPLT